MKIAIIGSNGYIGRNLLSFLTNIGNDIIGFSSSDGNSINPQTGMLCDKFEIPAGTDAVVYLSQSPFYNQCPEMAWHLWNVNVASALKAAEASKKAAVKKFIYASTGNVYAPSFAPLSENSPLRRDNYYSLSKIHAEESLLLYRDCFDLSLIRIFGVYGQRQTGKLIPNLYNSIKQGKTVLLGTNPNNSNDNDGLKISLCFIDDVLKIISDLLDKPNMPIINVAGEQVVSVREIAAFICRHLGLPLNCELTGKPRQFDLIADISLLKSIIELRFTPFESGLRKTLESYDS